MRKEQLDQAIADYDQAIALTPAAKAIRQPRFAYYEGHLDRATPTMTRHRLDPPECLGPRITAGRLYDKGRLEQAITDSGFRPFLDPQFAGPTMNAGPPTMTRATWIGHCD